MTRNLSIRVLAPLLLLLPVLLASVIILVMTYAAAERAAERDAFKELIQIQTTAGERVDALLVTPVRAAALNHDLLAAGKLDPTDTAGWRSALLAESSAFPTLSAITWGAEDGCSTWIARYGAHGEKRYYAILDNPLTGQMREYPIAADGTVSNEPSSTFAFDPRSRPWYIAAARARGPAWSEPYAWAGDQNGGAVTVGLSHSRPIVDDAGKMIGVVSADFNLDDIATFLSGLRIGESGMSFIVDRQGRLIASSEPTTLVDAQNNLLTATESENVTIASLSRYWFEQSASNESAGRGQLRTPGGVYFTTRSSIGGGAGLEWIMITAVPEDDFMADARQTRSTILAIGVVVVILTLAVGYVISRQLSQPVVKLQEHLVRIGEGEFDQEIELNQTLEFRQLSETVNRMSADLKDRIELRRSLATAMEVQQSLLPQSEPSVNGLEIAGKSNYCDQTGGDYYDFLEMSELSDNEVAFVVGDVMGHGIAAAMLMATARGILRSRSTEQGSTGQLLTHLNDQLFEVTKGQRFMTMILAILDSRSRMLRWAGAGHDPPLVFDPSQNEFLEIDGGAFPLGVVPGHDFEEHAVGPLPKNAVLAILTDGVFEARNAGGEMYGKGRIRKIIADYASRPASEIAAALERDLDNFQGDTAQEDDITFVIVKVQNQD